MSPGLEDVKVRLETHMAETGTLQCHIRTALIYSVPTLSEGPFRSPPRTRVAICVSLHDLNLTIPLLLE